MLVVGLGPRRSKPVRRSILSKQWKGWDQPMGGASLSLSGDRLSKATPRAQTAHAMRASLLASATAALL